MRRTGTASLLRRATSGPAQTLFRVWALRVLGLRFGPFMCGSVARPHVASDKPHAERSCAAQMQGWARGLGPSLNARKGSRKPQSSEIRTPAFELLQPRLTECLEYLALNSSTESLKL